jgi:hypothetical protein
VPTVERGIAAGGLLLDRDRRRQALDQVDVGLAHQLQELARIGRQALDVAPLALGVDGVERQARLARAGEPGQHHELAARDVHADVLQIVLARAAHARAADVGFPRLEHRAQVDVDRVVRADGQLVRIVGGGGQGVGAGADDLAVPVLGDAEPGLGEGEDVAGHLALGAARRDQPRRLDGVEHRQRLDLRGLERGAPVGIDHHVFRHRPSPHITRLIAGVELGCEGCAMLRAVVLAMAWKPAVLGL